MGGHGALIIGLKNPSKFKSVSAFAPIVNPMKCPWGEKAFSGYLGTDKNLWREWDACELVKAGRTRADKILIDQGTADEFFDKQLLTANFTEACKSVGQSVEIRYQKDYDHSYYFISTFIRDHLNFHFT